MYFPLWRCDQRQESSNLSIESEFRHTSEFEFIYLGPNFAIWCNLSSATTSFEEVVAPHLPLRFRPVNALLVNRT